MNQKEINQKESLEERKHKCSVCGKGFTCKSKLDEHLRSHTGERPYHCATCNKQFIRKNNLKVHMLIHSEEKLFECSICSKKFSEKSYLNVHVRIHSGEKPFECSICLTRFTQKSHLNTHMSVHTREKQYECPTCQKRFTIKERLKAHLRVHSGEKSHQCSICPKQFRRKNHLNTHMLIHSGEKPYECPKCHKRFSQRGNLRCHLKIHFDKKGSSERHVKSSHLNKTSYKCDISKKGFHLKDAFINHPSDYGDEKQITNKTLASRSHSQGINKINSTKKQDTSEPKGLVKQHSHLHDQSSLEGRCLKTYGIIKQEFEVPIIKQELISGEDLADGQIPSCLYQPLDMKQEPIESADPTCINLFDDLFIKEETEVTTSTTS